MEGELLDLSQNLKATCALERKAKEALIKESRMTPERNKKLLKEYKESHGF